MKRLQFILLLLGLILAACTWPPSTIPATDIPFTPTPSTYHSTPRFQVFILNPLTTCLVGNEFASGNVCAGTACGDCDCTWEEHDPPAPQVGLPPERLDDPEYASYEHKICVNITLTN